MGCGIAYSCAIKGIQVLLSDRKQDIVTNGMGNIQRLMERQIKGNALSTEQAHAAIALITPGISLEPFRQADFVIEAVSENEEVKANIFRQLDKVTSVQTVLASNTSSISITRLAAVTSKPHRVVGMHFQLPVHEQPLVELARGMHTSEGTFTAARSLAVHLGKVVAVSQDRPGFVMYRCLLPFINEAFFCLMEGTASAEDIDKCLKLGTAMRQGPLRLADSIGLDTCLAIMRTLHANLGDGKYRPCPLLVQYVDAGMLGVKTGKGIFMYERGSPGDGTPHNVISFN